MVMPSGGVLVHSASSWTGEGWLEVGNEELRGGEGEHAFWIRFWEAIVAVVRLGCAWTGKCKWCWLGEVELVVQVGKYKKQCTAAWELIEFVYSSKWVDRVVSTKRLGMFGELVNLQKGRRLITGEASKAAAM